MLTFIKQSGAIKPYIIAMKYLMEFLYARFLQSNDVSTDSRSVKEGDLFFALSGPNFNGNKYVKEALDKGASFAVVDDIQYFIEEKTLLVNDSLIALQELARFHRTQLRCPVLGITGSNGKTTTKELIRDVLSKKYIVSATEGNLNNHIGVPLTLLKINPQTEFAIVEMGASAVGEIAFLSHLADPDRGLITNIGKAHTETFGGIEGVIRGKSELFDHLRKKEGQVLINNNDRVLKNMAKRFVNPIVYPESDLKLLSADPYIHYMSGDTLHETNLIGTYNFDNVSAAIAVGRMMEVPEKLIHEAVKNYIPDNNRSELSKSGSNLLIKDAYNANPDSIRASLLNFSEMEGTKIAVLGDMNELENPIQEHQDLGEWLVDKGIDEVWFCGELMKAAYEKYPEGKWFENVADLSGCLKDRKLSHTKILLKGSRSIHLEKLFPVFEAISE